MALMLDLTEAQQKEVKAIHLEQAKKRKAQMEARKKTMDEGKDLKPSKEDRFNRMNSQLDNQLATKSKFKSILNKEQFEKFEKANAMKGRQKGKMKGKRGQQQKAQKQTQKRGQKRQRN
jgi:protein CpxP